MPGVPTFAVVTPPAPFVALADARAYPGVADCASDMLVQQQINAALAYLDGPDGTFNRSFGQQTIACTITPGLGFRRPEPIILRGGPVLSLVSVTGLPGTDSFGSPAVLLDGDALLIRDCFGWSFGPQSPSIVATYTAGSPPGVLALAKPVVLAMAAKLIAAAAAASRDPSLRSESIPDTFSKTWGASGPGGLPDAAFGDATLAPIAHLRRWS